MCPDITGVSWVTEDPIKLVININQDSYKHLLSIGSGPKREMPQLLDGEGEADSCHGSELWLGLEQ